MPNSTEDCGRCLPSEWVARPNTNIIYKIGIYGWRKRCLYCLILVLVTLIVINMALTFWIIRVLDFSLAGIGSLEILPHSLKVTGKTEFSDTVYASSISSSQDASLRISSLGNVTFNAKNNRGRITNTLEIADGYIRSIGDRFEIVDTEGKRLFYADATRVLLGADKLTITDEGGATFSGSVLTPLVSSPAKNLRLESPTGALSVTSKESLSVASQGSGISLTSYSDLTVTSLNDAIFLNAASINLPMLPVSEGVQENRNVQAVYQICVCSSGALFAADPELLCRASKDVCNE